MRSKGKIVVLLLAAVLAASVMTACGGGGSTSLTGYFILSEMTSGTETMTSDDLSILGDSYIVLEGDGKGYVVLLGETNDLTYTDAVMTVDGSDMNYRISGDKLILSDTSDYSMTFTKSNDTPPARS